MVEVSFYGYDNPTGRCVDCPIPMRKSTASCCDNFSMTTCSGRARCDSYFYFCLRSLGDRTTSNGCSYFGSITSRANYNDAPLDVNEIGSVLGIQNPLQLSGLTENFRVLKELL